MTASILQETADVSTTSQSTVSKAFASNATPGSVIHVILIATGTTITAGFGTPSDGTNAYTLLDKTQATNHAIGHWWAPNTSSGILTISENMGITTTQHMLIIREIGGVAASPLDGHNANFSNSQATGTNAQSVAATSSNGPNFASAVGWYLGTGEAVGTTLAWQQGQLNLQNSIMGGFATSEHLRFASAGSTTATWSPSGTTAKEAVACIAIFDELVTVLEPWQSLGGQVQVIVQ